MILSWKSLVLKYWNKVLAGFVNIVLTFEKRNVLILFFTFYNELSRNLGRATDVTNVYRTPPSANHEERLPTSTWPVTYRPQLNPMGGEMASTYKTVHSEF